MAKPKTTKTTKDPLDFIYISLAKGKIKVQAGARTKSFDVTQDEAIGNFIAPYLGMRCMTSSSVNHPDEKSGEDVLLTFNSAEDLAHFANGMGYASRLAIMAK